MKTITLLFSISLLPLASHAQDKFVYIVENGSNIRLDSIRVSFYQVSQQKFDLIDKSLTHHGQVKIPALFNLTGKIKVEDIRQPPLYGAAVINGKCLDSCAY